LAVALDLHRLCFRSWEDGVGQGSCRAAFRLRPFPMSRSVVSKPSIASRHPHTAQLLLPKVRSGGGAVPDTACGILASQLCAWTCPSTWSSTPWPAWSVYPSTPSGRLSLGVLIPLSPYLRSLCRGRAGFFLLYCICLLYLSVFFSKKLKSFCNCFFQLITYAV